MARNHAPVSSFGAELHAVLREGAQKRITLRFDTPALAVRFNQRINQLRNAMKHAKHPDWENLYRCGCYIDRTDRRVLHLGPKDHEFRQALENAGIPVETLPTVSVDITSAPPGSVDEFLSTLVDATSVQKNLTEDTDSELSQRESPASQPKLEDL